MKAGLQGDVDIEGRWGTAPPCDAISFSQVSCIAAEATETMRMSGNCEGARHLDARCAGIDTNPVNAEIALRFR